MKNCGHTHGTHKKIEAYVRKHRATGGAASDDDKRGDDDAKKDEGRKNMEYTKDSNVNREAEEKKAAKGGKIAIKRKSGGLVAGLSAASHGGRRARASGGGCESQPFTTARSGREPSGHSTEKMAD